jgi:hypothetical protein
MKSDKTCCAKAQCDCAIKEIKELEQNLENIVEDPNLPKVTPRFRKRKHFRRIFK